MKPKSLKHTLLLTVGLLVILSGIVISQLMTHRYSASLLEGAAAQAENVAHNLALDAADKILINDLVAVQKLLDDQMLSNPSLAYLFVVKDHRVLSHTFSEGLPLELVSANAPADLENGRLEKIVNQRGERFLDIAWPIFSGKAGVLRLGLSEKPYQERVRQLRFQMALITLAVLLAALGAGYVFIHRLTRPLLALAKAVEKIDEGNLETRVDVAGRAEVTKLAAAFNSMLERVKHYTQRLETTNQKLKEKNIELDRAHRQLRTSFAISRDLSALADLESVCTHLIRTFKTIIECRGVSILIFGNRDDTLFVFSDRHVSTLGRDALTDARIVFNSLKSVTFIDPSSLRPLHLSDNLQLNDNLAAFPFEHHGELLGIMLIACPGECQCVTSELEILELILKQTSGVIKRASLHEEEIRDLRARIEPAAGFSGLVGKDPTIQLVYRLIEDVAPTDSTILIQGESGTGKELVARAIQARSPRSNKAFVVINCSAYPSTLLESELFGHEKGAFTGASRRRVGRFEQADGGTVFLDEIAEISHSAQIKLLRVLQSQKFERIGGEQTVSVDVRILAATNKNLQDEVRKGSFREDLFYRLNVIPIYLPALRDRRNDIPVLANHFLSAFADKQRKDIGEFSSEAMRLLLKYPWPGNVRELENSIEHAVVLAKGSRIEPIDLPDAVVEAGITTREPAQRTIQQSEVNLLRQVLEECNWNKTAAASRLGISRSTLYEKLKRYQITLPTIH